jgi:septal ring factor EnvC (AmiA/AmiB activator)
MNAVYIEVVDTIWRLRKSLRKKEGAPQEIIAAFIASKSSRKTCKQQIHDVIHDLIAVREDEVKRKGKLRRASLKQRKGRSRTFGIA